MKLVIVESPNKKATIKKYLGGGYEVLATAGHFRDLPKKALGVDTTTFTPTYEVSEEKASFLAAIRKAAREADTVLLATDADREGEAIAWHLVDELRLKAAKRIRFTEITPKALAAAVDAAGPVDMNLVDAQQARRIIDRFVGYQLSPLLAPFGKGHSAGRVQSATLHLVVARELEREAHVVTPYWTLSAKYDNGLTARYAPVQTEDDEDVQLHSDEAAAAVIARARGPHIVSAVETKPVDRKPKAPFTTSTLQQAASVALKLKPDATMEVAQTLFEKGHITYHRTDSVAVSADAAAMARTWLSQHFPEALPSEPPVYKSKASSQGAHECLRPTSLDSDSPEGLAGDELRLYQLIRTRFVASQCAPAKLSATVVTITSGDTTWRARGTTTLFESFLRLSAADEDASPKDAADESRLPVVTVGQQLTVVTIDSKRQETKPPPRYTEATLVKAMESEGIGRPSTFANTINVLFTREYLAPADDKYVLPTARGRLIDSVLTTAFPALVAADYTRVLEETLDDVAGGARPWRAELGIWYRSWENQLKAAAPLFSAELQKRPELATQAAADAPKPTGKPCPLCTKELFLRVGKKGPFLSCSGYPTCTYSADPSAKPSDKPCPVCGGAMHELAGEHGPYARCLKRDCKGLLDLRPVKVSEKPCPKCGGPTHERDGKYGPYARCANRECGGIVDLKPPATEKCPVCGGPMHDKGEFLSCASYPTCRGSWDKKALVTAKKQNRTCPACKTRLLVAKKGPRGTFVGCSGYPVCKHIEDAKESGGSKR
ncbi:MAG: type I DNA topoisomerase [Archangium sp.]|nr:type I DNA topoisomerase [Archangium sp.]